MNEIDLTYRGLKVRVLRHDPGCFYTTCLLGEYDQLRIKPGDVVLDAGANIGDFTVLAAKRAGKGGLVVAIEPNALAREILRYNVTRNGLANVRIVDSFISGSAGHVDLEDFGSYSERSTRTGHRRQPRQTIDGILETLSLPNLDVLKMDIEGEEASALRGQRFLSTIRELCVEVHGKRNEEAVLEILGSAGFDLRLVGWRVKLGNYARGGIPRILTTLRAEIETRAYASRFVASALIKSGSPASSALTGNRVYYGAKT